MIALLALAACSVETTYVGTAYKCGEDNACPDGTVCTAGYCLPPQTPGGTTCAMDVASGDQHVCALRTDGTVWCWGRNESGELGDGTITDASSPVQSHLTPTATSVITGSNHTCAIAIDTSVWCWGANPTGQLGDGTSADAREPTQVKNVTGATQLAAGLRHTCAIANGTVSCWGGNDHGQLGDGTHTNSSTAIPVPGLTGVTAIAAGGEATCAIDGTNELYCWGDNGIGQLGDGTTADKLSPTAVAANARSVTIGDGFVTVAMTDGTVYSAGTNATGRLGDSGVEPSTGTPVRTLVGGEVTQLSAHAGHACAVDSEHGGWCWGYDYDGEFFDKNSTEWDSPVKSLANVSKIVLGQDHACVLTQTNTIVCAGYNGWGQLGDGVRTSEPSPQDVKLADTQKIFAGGLTTCATHADHSTTCWGNGTQGQLGDGGAAPIALPESIAGFANATLIAQNDNETCSLDLAGTVHCAGNGDLGRLGDNSGYLSRVPLLVAGLAGPAVDLAVGDIHVCAALGAKGAMCWGGNGNNQLGGGTMDYSSGTPLKVIAPLTNAMQVAAGDSWSCALTSTGAVYCWGNSYVTGMNTGTPVLIAGVANVTQISGHGSFICALSSGNVFCWGANGAGQVGNNSTDGTSTPTMVLSGVAQLGVGHDHACAIKTDGTVWCWG
ncbi:MAG TPA: hypothetical protein VGC41_11445, partial [Kofleriaceae bacterium]